MLTLAATLLSAGAVSAPTRVLTSAFWRASGPQGPVWSVVVDAVSGREYAVAGGVPQEVLVRTGPGVSWLQTAPLPRSGAGEGVRIALDSSDPGLLYAAFGGCDGILQPNPTCHGSLYRSDDGGDSWVFLAIGAHGALVSDPGRPATIYAAIATDPVPSSGVLVRSDDRGVTWRTLPVPTYSLPTAVAIASGRLLVGTSIGEVWLSDDEGESWMESDIDSTRDAVGTIAIDPAHPGQMYAGTASGVLRTTTAGATWSRVLHGDGIDQVAVSAGSVYAGGYGTAYRSDDGGESWQALPLPDGATITSLVADAPRNVLVVGTGSGVLERVLARPTRSVSPR